MTTTIKSGPSPVGILEDALNRTLEAEHLRVSFSQMMDLPAIRVFVQETNGGRLECTRLVTTTGVQDWRHEILTHLAYNTEKAVEDIRTARKETGQ
jgi:hypothetical protein